MENCGHLTEKKFKMKIYERMIKFKFKNLNIRCWMPSGPDDNMYNYKAEAKIYFLHVKELFSVLTWYDRMKLRAKPLSVNFRYVAESLSECFKMNACEVTDRKSGMGFVFYREWP